MIISRSDLVHFTMRCRKGRTPWFLEASHNAEAGTPPPPSTSEEPIRHSRCVVNLGALPHGDRSSMGNWTRADAVTEGTDSWRRRLQGLVLLFEPRYLALHGRYEVCVIVVGLLYSLELCLQGVQLL